MIEITARKCSEKQSPLIEVGKSYICKGVSSLKDGTTVIEVVHPTKKKQTLRVNALRFDWQILTDEMKFEREFREGVRKDTEKMMNEPYLVDALSFTEAESRITDEMSVYISGEFRVDAVKKCNASEVLFSEVDDDDKWYKAKLQFITIDEKTEKEKRSNTTYLVQAKSLARALRYVDEFMGKTMIDYDIVGLNETKIMDVFKYEPKTEEEKKDGNKEA